MLRLTYLNQEQDEMHQSLSKGNCNRIHYICFLDLLLNLVVCCINFFLFVPGNSYLLLNREKVMQSLFLSNPLFPSAKINIWFLLQMEIYFGGGGGSDIFFQLTKYLIDIETEELR